MTSDEWREEDVLKKHRELHLEYLLEILRLKRELSESNEAIARMQTEHDRLQRQIERLKSAHEEIASAVG